MRSHPVRTLALLGFLTVCPVLAFAQVGAPLVGLETTVGGSTVLFNWTGTEEDEGQAAELAALGRFTILGVRARRSRASSSRWPSSGCSCAP